jgi:hypothetical protein
MRHASSLARTVENVGMTDIAAVLELLYGARHRYRTVRGVLESWHDPKRLMEAHRRSAERQRARGYGGSMQITIATSGEGPAELPSEERELGTDADTGITRNSGDRWGPGTPLRQRVLEKIGSVRERLPRSYASWRGSRQDVLMYSLILSDLSDDWV